MIRNYFRVIHITIDKITIGNSQPVHDALGMSPEVALKVLLSGSYRAPSRDQYKN